MNRYLERMSNNNMGRLSLILSLFWALISSVNHLSLSQRANIDTSAQY